jgi:hypothetical protein
LKVTRIEYNVLNKFVDFDRGILEATMIKYLSLADMDERTSTVELTINVVDVSALGSSPSPSIWRLSAEEMHTVDGELGIE